MPNPVTVDMATGDVILGTHDKNQFVHYFNEVANDVHRTALDKGWYGPDGKDERNMREVICLMHSELSEACEASRSGNPPDDKIPEFSGIEAEFADVIIRIMDTAKREGFDVAGAIIAKSEYNKSRSYRHGGKEA
ncbi:MAG: hypothetical protein AAF702_45745 [Chloroflexota bacterium]